jgi:citrate lyase beta subunit
MLRSFLIVPAVKLDRYWAHLQSLNGDEIPDSVVVDLEDSIPPNRKVEAVEIVDDWLRDGMPPLARPVPIAIKIDNPRSPHCEMQLAGLRDLASHFEWVKIAKLEQPEEVRLVQERFAGSGVGLLPTIETPLGLANRDALLRACRQCGATYASFGAGDMASALLIRRSYDLDILRYVFVELALSSAVHFLLFVDSPSRVIPSAKVDDWREVIARECAWAFANGAKAKTAIHPAQIPIIHRAWAEQFDLARAEHLESQFRAEPRFRSLVDEATGEYVGTPSLAAAQRLRALVGERRGNG